MSCHEPSISYIMATLVRSRLERFNSFCILSLWNRFIRVLGRIGKFPKSNHGRMDLLYQAFDVFIGIGYLCMILFQYGKKQKYLQWRRICSINIRQYGKLLKFNLLKALVLNGYENDRKLNKNLCILYKLVKKHINMAFRKMFRINIVVTKALRKELILHLGKLKDKLVYYKAGLVTRDIETQEQRQQVKRIIKKITNFS